MRVLLLSDIHGNWPALEAILQSEYDGLWFLGDLVGYGPFAMEVSQWFGETFGDRNWQDAHLWVLGNHDEVVFLAPEVLEYKEGLSPYARDTLRVHREVLMVTPLWEVLCARMEAKWREVIGKTDGGTGRKVVTGLPLWEEGDTVWVLSHGALWPPEVRLYWYLWPWQVEVETELRALDRWRQEQGWKRAVLLVGHTHAPMAGYWTGQGVRFVSLLCDEWLILQEGSWILNPGSVGVPRYGAFEPTALLLDLAKHRVRLVRRGYKWKLTLQGVWNRYPPALAERIEHWFSPEGVASDEKVQRYRAYYQVTKKGLVVQAG